MGTHKIIYRNDMGHCEKMHNAGYCKGMVLWVFTMFIYIYIHIMYIIPVDTGKSLVHMCTGVYIKLKAKEYRYNLLYIRTPTSGTEVYSSIKIMN